MKVHAILSMLVVDLLAAAESATEDRFSVAVQLAVDCVTHAIRSIVAPFKSHGTVNLRKGRHGEWTSSTKISRT